jgi:uncharacterized protein YaeQ
MALSPTLYDFDVSLSHVDRSIEAKFSLKAARHPSETLERVWLRVLAYCWQHGERIGFGPGLGEPDAPDIEARDYSNEVTLWVRVGKADPLKVQRAADQNPHARVAVLFESPAKMEAFVAEAKQADLGRLSKVELAAVEPDLLRALASNEQRRTKLTVTLVGDHFYIDRSGETLEGPLSRSSL